MTDWGVWSPFSSLGVQAARLHEGFLRKHALDSDRGQESICGVGVRLS